MLTDYSERDLKIYKASAGSGKTFTLAVEYIKLLVLRPDNYRHILAVTFTNKATAEMKQRILSQLYGIGYALPDSDDYVDNILSAPELEPVFESHGVSARNDRELFVRRRCRRALSLMMHDYSRFRIETIDSFFQSIIRELAHELNLTANLRVDLNSDEVLAEAVQVIVESIVRKDTDKQAQEVFRSIFSFIQERIEENTDWNVINDVIAFGANIFNEQYLAHSEESRTAIAHPDILRAYGMRLRKVCEEQQAVLRGLGERFREVAEGAGLTRDDLAKTSSPFDYYDTLSKGQFPKPLSNTLKARLTDSSKWVTKAKASRWLPFVEDTLMPLFRQTVDEVSACSRTYNTAQAIRRHIYYLSLIHVIDTMVRRLNEDANRFLLADTGHFLNALIAESDVPFIYERTGTAFHYIMIDEFQDTSMLQWKNFVPLIKNSLDGGHRCLIVGDVKQSIYRWRNSDWGILNGLRPDAPGPFRYFIDDTMSQKNTNFRSDGNVVTFNNMFFESATDELCRLYIEKTAAANDAAEQAGHTNAHSYVEEIRKAYACLAQKFRADKEGKGYVRVEYLAQPDKSSSTDIDGETLKMEDLELRRIVQAVRMLTDRGVPPGDISILIRFNRSIPTIMNHFANLPEDTFPACGGRIQIVSDDAFRLDSSPAVCCIVQALRLIVSPKSRMERIQLAYRYQTDVCRNEELLACPALLFQADEPRLDELLPAGLAENLDRLAQVPLFRLVQQLVEILDIGRIEKQSSYLFSFFDKLTDYLSRKTGDIEDFLDFWQETLASTTIPVGSLDGIHITSIHKSKGLEFKSVIVPFCDWSMDGKVSNLLWCTTQDKTEPFDTLPLVPVRYDSQTNDSQFHDDYEYETLKNYVDNLNMIYVAFTRAKNNLVIISGERARGGMDQLVAAALFDHVYKGKPDPQGTCPYEHFGQRYETDDHTLRVFEVGSIRTEGKKAAKTSENVLEQTSSPEQVLFRQHRPELTFLQSNRSAAFIESTLNDGGEADNESDRQDRYLNEGRIFHELMASIRMPSDVDMAITRLDMEGLFPDTFYRDHIKALVKKAFRNPRAAQWFDPHWRVINECDILYRDASGTVVNKRPDRVVTDGERTLVIDYKTGRQDNSHLDQVSGYMKLLRQMGYPQVEGYLWYIRREEIVRIPD